MFSASSPPAPAQPAKRAAPSIISADVTITGILQSSGDIQIDGRVDGNVRAASLMIGETAHITGEIQADSVTVRGKVEGSIRARAVALASDSHFEGEIIHETLEVESGAFVQGHFRHCADALAETIPDANGEDRRRPGSPMRSGQDDEVEEPVKIAKVG